MTDTTTPATTTTDLIVKTNQDIENYKKQGAHILAPITLQTIPALHRPVAVAVYINPDPKQKEVYPQSGQLALSGIGWKKLADGMGIQIDDARSGRVDNGQDPNRCEYRIVGYIKSQDGTWRKLIGDKEIRMENVIEELYQSKRQKVKDYLDDPKDGPAFRRAFPDPEVWVQEQVRKEALQIKKHILGRAQSGAFARMVKSIGIRETYTAAELQKPFVFPKLVFELDPNHPEDRAFLRTQAAGAIDALYPSPRRQEPSPVDPYLNVKPLEILDAGGDVIEHTPPPQQPTAAQGAPASTPAGQAAPSSAQTAQAPQAAAPQAPPSPDEVLTAYFREADAKAQKDMLEKLIKRKNYQGKLAGDLLDWKPEHRQGFFDKLIAMADAPVQTTAKFTDELPFE